MRRKTYTGKHIQKTYILKKGSHHLIAGSIDQKERKKKEEKV